MQRWRRIFAQLELPDETNLYDLITLTLRPKDAIFTFNWDPFLMQARLRLVRSGVRKFPKLFFLHGNVTVGYCLKDRVSGMLGRTCSRCGAHAIAPLVSGRKEKLSRRRVYRE